MIAHLRRSRISPKKANIVAGLVRNKKAVQALDILKFTPKKAAKLLYKVVQSAIANAENNDSKKAEELQIKEIIVNKGPSFKRHLPSTRGRALPITKPTSHISVELEVKS